MTDFYKQVPKTLEENLRYRLQLRRAAEHDERLQRALWTACKHDVLFFFNAFCWLYEPRPRFGADGRLLPKQIPMISWVHQDPVILELRKNLGLKDIGIEKSRGEGMSWIGVLLALHDWQFDDLAKVGLVSDTEKKADDPGNMDSLMAKIDWELSKLPKWMAGIKDVDWKRNLADHALVNYRNGSQINAFAATGTSGRAGRYKWFLSDELAFWQRGIDSDFMASVRGATDSRLVISTPNGADGEYWHFMHTPSSALRLVLDWKDNPTRNRGLYKFEEGKPVAAEPLNNPLPKHYDPPAQDVLDLFSRLRVKGFKLEEKLRSPWYDGECDRADATPQSIAQELDRDYGGSMYRIFGIDFMHKGQESVRSPQVRGMLSYHPETLEPEFDRGEDGQMLLWTPLDERLLPPLRPYVVAADISSGLGGSYTSNSVLAVIDLLTMEQVLEYAVNTMEPPDFADLAIATSKWFYDAYLAWEINGPGRGFTKRVQSRAYLHVYYRKQEWKRSKKDTKEMGWHTNPNSKEALFGELSRSVRSGELKIRSKICLDECGQYVRGDSGRIEHVLARSTEDDSSKGEAHGDRVIALGVALMAARDRPLPSKSLENWLEREPPANTLAARVKAWEEQDEKGDDWDDRDNSDLALGKSSLRRLAGRFDL